MNLNAIEKELLNSPVRALLQRRYEARLMERLGGRLECMRVLEIGCGRGVGTEIIFERFGGWEVRAFDINCGTVACAKLRRPVQHRTWLALTFPPLFSLLTFPCHSV